MTSRQKKVIFLWALAVVSVGVLTFLDPMPQDPAFHDFSDQQETLGIANFSDVISNLPFLLVGVLGLFHARRAHALRVYWLTIFTGVSLVAFGSSWYHLDPTNGTLMWDRLPMTITFMALFTFVIADRISPRAAAALFVPLLVLGIGSVLWWHHGEQRGSGDLRWYGMVQFFPLLAIPAILVMFPLPDAGTRLLVYAFIAYAGAKVMEVQDHEIHDALGFVSGHTLKHFAAAVATWFLYRLMRSRTAGPGSPLTSS